MVRFIGERNMFGFTFSASSFCASNASKEGVRRRFAEGFRLGDDVGTAIFVLPDKGLGVLMPVCILQSAICIIGFNKCHIRLLTYHSGGS